MERAKVAANRFWVKCPCGCQDVVGVYDEGFNATTLQVLACSTKRADGIHSSNYPKSAGLRWERESALEDEEF